LREPSRASAAGIPISLAPIGGTVETETVDTEFDRYREAPTRQAREGFGLSPGRRLKVWKYLYGIM